MSGVLNSEDPFCITFGKQNWEAFKTAKAQHKPYQPTCSSKDNNILDRKSHFNNTKRLSETHNKKGVLTNDFFKQNVDQNIQTLRKTKPHSSMTDRGTKQSINLLTPRQEITIKYSENKFHKSTREQPFFFDGELNKRLKEIETATKLKIDKVRTISENKKLEFIYESPGVFDKYRLINTQKTKKTKLTTVNPTLNRYRQEMTKIDTLISRVNARISSSAAKNQNQQKRVFYEKA